jgi:2-C-methyl-D-erythritol 2,4-cyclodiphosphate synthase
LNRIGIGYDLHRLVRGRTLVLGGVTVDYPLGLEGFSDADVLLHALADALLGAAAMGDIGHHFPPGDERFQNISSLLLLNRVKELLAAEGWKVVNTDTVIIAEEPQLAPYIDRMRENIAEVLQLNRCRVGVKATTTEGLGVCGRGEGIAAQAVVLLEMEESTGPTGHEAL